MKIGIIGAGNIGGALARRFVELGHDVSIANSRGPATLREVEAETGATAVEVRDAARGRDVIVVTIPEKHVPELPSDLFDGVGEDVVVIDTGNYYPRRRDDAIEAIEAGTPESVWVAQSWSGSPERSMRSPGDARLGREQKPVDGVPSSRRDVTWLWSRR